MSSKSSGIGLGSIIFWIFMGFLWFGDSDDDSTEVEIVEQDAPIITEAVKNKVKDVGAQITDIVKQVKNNIEETIETAQTETIDKPEEVMEEVIYEPPRELEKEELIPVEDKPQIEEMKKL